MYVVEVTVPFQNKVLTQILKTWMWKKASILPLPRIIVRENNSDRARRNRGLYLIYRSEGKPDMYDLECPNSDRRLELVTLLKEAIHKCPVSGFVHLSLPRVLLCRDRDRLHSSSHPALGRTLAAAGSAAALATSRQSRAIGSAGAAAAAAAAGLQTAAESLSTKITPLVERLSQCDSNIQNSCKTRMQTLAEIYSLLLSCEQVALLQDVLFFSFLFFHSFKLFYFFTFSFLSFITINFISFGFLWCRSTKSVVREKRSRWTCCCRAPSKKVCFSNSDFIYLYLLYIDNRIWFSFDLTLFNYTFAYKMQVIY